MTRTEIATRVNEEWRPITGYEGLYEISSLGNVRGLDRIVARRTRGGKPGLYPKRGTPVRPHSDNERLRVALYDASGRRGSPLVSALVSEAFFGIPRRRTSPASVADRLARLSSPDDETGCQIWRGSKNGFGYGRVSLGGRKGTTYAAHRVAYELANGPIPHGLVIDHLCRTPSCINPDHLEPVTPRENVLRGDSRAGLAMRRATCIRGHPWTEASTYWSATSGRECRVCKRENKRLAKSRRREAARANLHAGVEQ